MLKYILIFITAFVSADEVAIIIATHRAPETIKEISVAPSIDNEVKKGRVELRYDIQVTDLSLQEIGKRCPALETLCFRGNQISDAGIINLAAGCPRLRVLIVDTNVARLTDCALEALAQGCPNLETVNISGHAEITDQGIEALAIHCPQLAWLTLIGLKNLTDASLFTLAAYSRNLVSLNIKEIPLITEEGINTVKENCPKLMFISGKKLIS